MTPDPLVPEDVHDRLVEKALDSLSPDIKQRVNEVVSAGTRPITVQETVTHDDEKYIVTMVLSADDDGNRRMTSTISLADDE